MPLIWIYTFLAVLGVSLVSLVGIFTLSLSRERLNSIMHLLVSFAVGSLLGGAFIHLLPEIYTKPDSIDIQSSLLILSGILIFFMLEKLVRWRHCHNVDCVEHTQHLVPMNLVGDSLHNFIDGIIIAGAFQIDIQVGLAATLAVTFHELPQEIGDFGVLLHGGLSVRRALVYNFLTGLTSLIGAAIALVIGGVAESFASGLLPVATGGFIYIAGSDLIPELHSFDDPKKTIGQLIFIVLGILIMALLPH